MRISYNAPFTLTFAIICAGVRLIADLVPGFNSLFTVGTSMDFGNIADYFRLFSHAMGHGDWLHYLGNFTLILLLGPILEEKYGSQKIFLMSFITALITGILNVLFFSTGLLGASGIVFMLIILSSFTNMKKGDIPLTFILVMLLYLGEEILKSFDDDNVSQFAHIAGGIIGAVFGFKVKPKNNTALIL